MAPSKLVEITRSIMNRQEALIIAGMHRSGTSACAGVLYLLGIDFGKKLMKAAAENKRGYFENNRIYQLNEAVLKMIGATWDSVLPWPADWPQEKALQRYRKELAEIIQSEYQNDGLLAFKDPRLCRLWPFWQEVLDDLKIDYRFIIPVRNPLEVIQSLQKRNRFSLEKANLLWLEHYFEIEAASRMFPRVILNFKDLLSHPRETMKSLAERLKINWPRNFEETQGKISEFLEKELVNYTLPDPDSETRLLPATAKLYEALLSLAARDGARSSARDTIDLLRAEYATLRDFFYHQEILKSNQEKETAGHELEDKNRKIIRMEAQLYELNRQILGLINSKSWRLLSPARAVHKKIKGFLLTLRKAAIKQARAFYHRLPLSFAAKSRLKHSLYMARKFFLPGNRGYQPEQNEKALELGWTGPIQKNPNGWREFQKNLKIMDYPDFEFPSQERPAISIIIPVHNKIEFTFNCLKSIHEHTSGNLTYEILVIDDCSTDRTGEVLSKIKGLRIFRNETNQGFLESCNLAADRALGEFLVYLNNDTLVRPGWLDWLWLTFENFPEAGIVGSKTLFPEGLLQEAGGLVWRDGKASHYGRLDDPNRPQYSYLREVDYCSAASLMIPRELFLSLGKFDRDYSPAYYEDVDLAFKVRAAGKKVFYQPNSRVVHFEGITNGTDVSRGIKKYQAINQNKFSEKWKAVLTGHAEKGQALEQEKERRIKKRLLIIDECVCLPDQDAGSFRMMNLIHIARQLGFKITFFPDNRAYLQPYTIIMQGQGIEVLYDSYIKTVEQYLKENGNNFDAVILSRLNVAKKHLEAVQKYCRQALVIFDTVDLHFLRERREADLKGDAKLRRAAQKSKQLELDIAGKADVTLVVSEAEKNVLKEAAPSLKVEVVSTIHPVVGNKTAFGNRRDLLFVGGFRFSPNVDAVLYFVNEIFLSIRQRLTDVKIYIIGGNPPPEIEALASDQVIITGQVKDIEPYLNRCRISVAPLRWGAGVKGKINLSMSYGLPVVATAMAVEGMNLVDGQDVLVAENREEFVRAVVELYSNQALWNELSENGLENVRKYYSVETASRALASILNDNSRLVDKLGVTSLGR